MPTIFQRGSVWRLQAKHQGKTVSKTFDRRDEAERWLADFQQHGPKPVAPADLTVADLMDRYAKTISVGKKGVRWEHYRLTSLSRTFTMRAVDCDAATVAEWRDRRLKEVMPSTVNRELNLLSDVFGKAIKEWRLPLTVNPVRMIDRPAQPRPRTRRVPDADLRAILTELTWDGQTRPDGLLQWTAWVFAFALETMMRKGEILGITWRHVHEKRVHLPDTKNGDFRDVPLSGEARRLIALLSRGEPGDRVCQIESGTLDRYFREARDRAGVADLHFHDSRREALTRASRKLTMLELMKAVGHRDTRSVSVYYAPDADDMADKL